MQSFLRGVRRRASLAAKVLLLAAFLPKFLVGAHAAEIWFAPTDPVWRSVLHWPANDFMELFRPHADWPRSLDAVQVFEITKRFALESSDSDLSAVIETLKSRHIKLSVQATPLLWTDTCGVGIEGHGPANDMAGLASRIKKLGGELAYTTMDEPLWYGHYFERKLRPGDKPSTAACHLSIPAIAQQTAVKMKSLRAIFPNIVIGDDEPLGETPVPAQEWANDIGQWLDAYSQAMGEPLGYFHADVVWSVPNWRFVLSKVVPRLTAAGVTFGVIYNGAPADLTDAAWLDAAYRHSVIIERDMRLHPAHAVFQSWMDRPRARTAA